MIPCKHILAEVLILTRMTHPRFAARLYTLLEMVSIVFWISSKLKCNVGWHFNRHLNTIRKKYLWYKEYDIENQNRKSSYKHSFHVSVWV
jgi:hypothetical protein